MTVIKKTALAACIAAAVFHRSESGEKTVVSLKDFCGTELRMEGIELPRRTTLHIRASGAGGEGVWRQKDDELFAYGWIIDAATRDLVWLMSEKNTTRKGDERSFDGTLTVGPGSYEVYFTVPVFAHHTTFSHFMMNIDHRAKSPFDQESDNKFFRFFKNLWSDDAAEDWEDRCSAWGMEIFTDQSLAGSVRRFKPPKALPHTVLKVTGLGDHEYVKKSFALSREATLFVYALGEGVEKEELVDGSWIIDASSRKRVWGMDSRNTHHAGGAGKNRMFGANITLDAGEYVLYCTTDDSHSPEDWNSLPPRDPMNWGVTIAGATAADAARVKETAVDEFRNVIVSLVKMKNNDSRSAGFTVRRDQKVRVYAIGERSNARRLMADYAFIMDSRTRTKVWAMDVNKTEHAGGASKNRTIDEVVALPRGSYVVTYNTDDSHAYDDWNDDPPFDRDHYGVTVMGVGAAFDPSSVGPYVEERDKNVVAQLLRVRNEEDRTDRFRLDKSTRLRIYSLGEGHGRSMYDYGWIEDVTTGSIVWEMTYAMTFHAGGHRKNRMVNTTIVLDKGEYALRYKSDDSHSYNDWNVDPPEDGEYWGITLYKDDGSPSPPAVPPTPEPPGDDW